MKFLEPVQFTDAHVTKHENYEIRNAKAARTGIQYYKGFEVGKPNANIIAIYRPEDEVFSKKSLASYAYKPITNDHPHVSVNSHNWLDHAKGFVGPDIVRDGEWVRVPLALMDAGIQQVVADGKVEVSMGYDMTLDWTPGVTDQGIKYDAVARDLRMNHLAIVDTARAGKEARVGDSDNEWVAPIYPDDFIKDEKLTSMDKPKTMTIDFNGINIEVSDQAASIINQLKDNVKNAEKKLAEKDALIAAKDRELAEKDVEIKDVKSQILSDEDLVAKVNARSELITKCSAFLNDCDLTKLSNKEIRNLVIDAEYEEGFSADKADAYLDAAFDLIMKKKAKKTEDPVRKVFKSRTSDGPALSTMFSKSASQSEYEKRISDAWKH